MKPGSTIVFLVCALAPGCSHPPPPEVRAGKADAGLHVDQAAQERLGIVLAPLESRSMRPQVRAYGRVVADPGQVYELRTSVAGTIHANREWPRLGERIEDRTVLGWIEPRFSPAEAADLAIRSAQANRDALESRAALAAAKTELDRVRTLNADGKNASDRALADAELRVQTEDARLKGAITENGAIGASRGNDAIAAHPLLVVQGGETTEIGARPEEAVDASALVLRLQRFDFVLARVELPVGVPLGAAQRASLVALAHPDRTLEGVLAGRAPDSEAQGEAYFVRAPAGDLALRPGEAVTAWLERDGPALEGVVVPRSAIVRHAGKAWVYVATGDASFERRELALEHALPEGWFTDAAWTKDARAVVGGAQSLLSTEILNASAGAGEEE